MYSGVGEMAQPFCRGLVLCQHPSQCLTAACNSGTRGFDALLWTPQAPSHMCVYIYTNTHHHMNLNKSSQNVLYSGLIYLVFFVLIWYPWPCHLPLSYAPSFYFIFNRITVFVDGVCYDTSLILWAQVFYCIYEWNHVSIFIALFSVTFSNLTILSQMTKFHFNS